MKLYRFNEINWKRSLITSKILVIRPTTFITENFNRLNNNVMNGGINVKR